MKTAEEILKEHTGHAHGLMDHTQILAMKEYAKQVAEKTLYQAYCNSKIKVESDFGLPSELYDNFNSENYLLSIDKKSILNTKIELP